MYRGSRESSPSASRSRLTRLFTVSGLTTRPGQTCVIKDSLLSTFGAARTNATRSWNDRLGKAMSLPARVTRCCPTSRYRSPTMNAAAVVSMNPVSDHSLETTAAAFIVGDLYLDVGQQRVTRAGSDIALPNLSFPLLVALVRAAPNVLSNESLMTQVWPGLVVSPETVNKRVNLLREALGDDSREPRYITGVRSRGYRLIASVSRVTEGALLPNLPTPIPEGSARAADSPIPVVPIEAPQTDAPKSRLPLGRSAALSVLTAGVLIAAPPGGCWGARPPV